MPVDTKQVSRDARERSAIQEAKRTDKSVKYIDDDGCEITATPGGHIFYNVDDWY